MKLIFLAITLITCFAYSNNMQVDECNVFFKEIGVRDFELGSDYQIILNSKLNFEKKHLTNGNEFLIFQEEKNILNKKRIIVYELTFRADKLIGYTFKIRIENDKKGLDYFVKVLEKLKINNQNGFIKGDNYAFMETNEYCKKFFRFCELDFNNYIFGGVNYNVM